MAGSQNGRQQPAIDILSTAHAVRAGRYATRGSWHPQHGRRKWLTTQRQYAGYSPPQTQEKTGGSVLREASVEGRSILHSNVE